MEEPSFFKKVSNFTKTAKEHLKNDMKYAKPKVYQFRMDTCNNCKLLNEGRCTLCGCKMAIKAQWEVSKCDNNYWEEPQKQIDDGNRLNQSN